MAHPLRDSQTHTEKTPGPGTPGQGGASPGYTTTTTPMPNTTTVTAAQSTLPHPDADRRNPERPQTSATDEASHLRPSPPIPSTTSPSASVAPTAAAAATTNTTHDQRPKHQKHVAPVVAPTGRLHTRVPSSKALKHHATASTKVATTSRRPHPPQHAATDPLTTTTARAQANQPASSHRRSQSDVKLIRDSSATNLKRNRSHHDIAKRNKSFDRLRAVTSHKPRIVKKHALVHPHPSNVQFELGTGKDNEDEDGEPEEDDDDEWVDDTTTSTPNPNTPRDQHPLPKPPIRSPHDRDAAPAANGDSTGNNPPEAGPVMSSADREIALHKEYLTSRLLKRIPSQGVPPQMSSTTVSVPLSQSQNSPPGTMSQESTAPPTPLTNTTVVNTPAGEDGLTSRFITRPGSNLHRDGSFYTHEPSAGGATRSLDDKVPRRPRSLAGLTNARRNDVSSAENSDDTRDRNRRRRPAAPPAETSRTQQKLNLQRASSVIEPGQPMNAATVGVGGMGMGIIPMGMGMGIPGANPLVNVPGGGYDGASSRDPRVSRLLDRTGMEYRVVRRYQNPVVRSFNRLAQTQGSDRPRQIPSRGAANGLPTPPTPATPDPIGGISHARHHARTASSNLGVPNARDHRDLHPFPHGTRRPTTPLRPQSARAMTSTTASFDADEPGVIADRLSGASLVEEEDDRIAVALRNLWEKPMDLSASQ